MFEWEQILERLKICFPKWKCEHCASIAWFDVVFDVDFYRVELCLRGNQKERTQTKPAENWGILFQIWNKFQLSLQPR